MSTGGSNARVVVAGFPAATAPASSDSGVIGWGRRVLADVNPNRYVVLIAFLLIFAFFAITQRDHGFLTSTNLINIGRFAAPIAVMAVGMTFALAAAEIDLSLIAVVGLSSLVAAKVVESNGLVIAALAALAVGATIGLVNGMLSVKLRIPSFLVTLGMTGIIGGVARSVNDLKSLPISDEDFRTVFGGKLGPVSSLLVWSAVALALGWVAFAKLRFGRHVLSVGANRPAAKMVGIRTDRVRIGVLLIGSIAAAFAGVMLAARSGVGKHDILADNELLSVIAAVVIGGTSMFGGRASVAGAVVGAVTISMMTNGLTLAGLSVNNQMIARGVIIVAAVAISSREKKEA